MNFTIQDYKKVVYTTYTRTLITLLSDVSIPKICCGIDPGSRNMGICVYTNNKVSISQIKFKPEKDSIQKMLNVISVVTNCVPLSSIKQRIAIVEGASYGDQFGQVELAEARAASIITLIQLGFIVKKIPPKRIRKLALGDGNNDGRCFDLPLDATASFLACLAELSL